MQYGLIQGPTTKQEEMKMKSVGKKSRYLWALLFAAALTILGCVPALAANTIATASTLPVNGTKTGKISISEAATYYKFTVDTAGELTMDAIQYCDGFYVRVVDKDDFMIWDSYNTPWWCPFRNTGGTETSPKKQSASIWIPKGTYYLKLQAFKDQTVNVNVSLTLNSYLVNPVTTDSYDSPVKVDILSGGKGCTSYCRSGTDETWYNQNKNEEDWFLVSVPATGTYKFRLDLKGREWGPKFTLYDKELNDVRFSFDNDVLLNKGYYYMKATGSDDGVAGYYHFFGVRTYPAKDAVLNDSKLNYKVTKAGLTGGKVEVTGVTYQNAGKSKITIPNTVTIDGITYSVTSISKYAFRSNGNVSTVTIGDNVTKIGDNAFSGCVKLKNLTIGKGLTTIGAQAFADCYKLKTVKIKSAKIKTVKSQAFYNTPSKTTYKVPKAKLKAYKKKFKKAGASTKKFKKL